MSERAIPAGVSPGSQHATRPDQSPPPHCSRRAVVVGALVLVFVLALGVVIRVQHPHFDGIYNVDELDYAQSLRPGLTSIYLGLAERNGFGFAWSALQEYLDTGRPRTFAHDAAAGDAAALRHFHPPLALYGVAPLVSRGIMAETSLRGFSLLLGLLTCVAVGWAAQMLVSDRPCVWRMAAGITAATVTAGSFYHATSSVEIAPHAAFGLTSVLCLGALGRAIQRRSAGWWYVGMACLGATALTVVYWVLLLPGVALTWYLVFVRSGVPVLSPMKALLRGVAAALAATVVLWPPYLLEGGFIKPLLIFGWYVFKPLPASGFSEPWPLALARTDWALVALGVLGVLGILLPRWRERAALAPAALYVLGFLAVNIRVAHMKALYVGDLIPALALVAVAPLALLASSWLRWLCVGAALGHAVLASWGAAMTQPADWRAALASVAADMREKSVFVSPGHLGGVMAYYVPEAHVTSDDDDQAADLWGRVGQGRFDVLVFVGPPPARFSSAQAPYRQVSAQRVDWMPVNVWRRVPPVPESVR